MLIDKLNVIRPNQLPESKSHLNISKIGYNSRSSYLQARPKTTNMPFGRLQLKTRGETINDMIIRRHENLVGRH